MRRIGMIVVSLGLVAGAGQAGASAQASTSALSGTELRSAVSGKTVHLSTPLGVSVPIRYSNNGTMSARTVPVVAAYVGSTRDTGSWWISGSKLCQRWNSWLDGKSYCYSFSVNGKSVRWKRNDGSSGSATISH